MPPKSNKRKADPAVLESQFETWTHTEEYRVWQELLKVKVTLKRISVTTRDIAFDLQPFLSLLHKFSGLMKVPRKSSTYEQIHMRTAFIPQVGLDLKFIVDGKEFDLIKEQVDIARDCRQAFCEVLTYLDKLKEYSSANFTSEKKDFIKKLTLFEKSYMQHLKKGHENLFKNMLFIILKPLYDAIEANINCYYLENRAHEKKKWFHDSAPDFRIRACETKFSETMTLLITELKTHGPLKYIPNIPKSLTKFKIDTEHSQAFQAFVNPVKYAWRNLRSVMKAQYRLGISNY